MNLQKLEKIFENQPKFRLTQAKQAIFKDLIDDWSQASTFPKELRETLSSEFPLEIKHQFFHSKDGNTIKALIALEDNQKIEAVLMKHEDRNTVCVSSQVGCPLKCAFCATGKMGFKRNLTVSEITNQILLFLRLLKKDGQKVTNIVFMGMGEPFLNYDNVITSIRLLNQEDTLYIGARRFSISTAGITEGIEKLTLEDLEINLALSIHTTNNNLRSRLMPINERYPLDKIIIALKKYQSKTRRKIMFEYILIDGLNDSEKDAHDLANFAKQFICVMNLIPCNKTGVYKPSSKQNIERFIKILQSRKVDIIQRANYGSDISGACGQLANKN